jgi:hypothetical protein
LKVFKKKLMDRQMSDVAYIERAAGWSKDLTRMRSRGPGDLENAMRSIEREYGIDFWAQWTLRYRPQRIKDIGIGLYARLEAAYVAECERQARKLRQEIQITKAIAGPDCASVRAAEALVGSQEGEG